MRILIPASKTFLEDKNANPFISLLYNGVRERGFDVDCGLEEFWEKALEYDVIFFQWPEATFEWKKIDVQRFQSYLDTLKDKGVKMVATCHNLHSHRYNEEADMLYDRLYASVDAIHHLGYYSYRLFLDKYPQCRHFVAQHPIFYDIVAQDLDCRLCRKRLKLPLGKQIILACNRPPVDLQGMKKRVLTRFGGGVVAELEMPNKQLCIDILDAMCRHDGLKVSSNIIEYIVKKVNGNICILEGVLNSLKAYSLVNDSNIDLNLAERVMMRFTKQN